jgi:OTU domain-containing protein 5
MKALNLQVVRMDGDGNCLFRAVAHQIYGDAEAHLLVREKCMAYILAGADYFKAFIADENIQAYCARKAKSGVWGDDVELQALSEIYDRPIQIFANSDKPMRTFHE